MTRTAVTGSDEEHMRLAERDVMGRLPAWTVGFLRDRCSALQHTISRPVDPILAHEQEVDSIRRWNHVLVAALDLPDTYLTPLESLQLLHARVAERMDRGGVGDISPEVEFLIQAVLIDQLQRETDDVVALLT